MTAKEVLVKVGGHGRVDDEDRHGRTRDRSCCRPIHLDRRPQAGALPATAAAYGLVVLSPLLAWLVWASWADGKASDQVCVAWFVSVALACVAGGALAPRRWVHWTTLAVLGVISTLVTLALWWSSEDDGGLALIGVLLAIPFVAAAAPLFLATGVRLSSARR